MGAPLIIDQNTMSNDWPCHYAKDRQGMLYITNGYQRHRLWDGVTDGALQSGIKPPHFPGLSDDTAAGSVSASETYYCGLKYIDYLGRESELSELTDLNTSAAGSHRVDWTSIDPSEETDRVRYVDLYRSTAGQLTTVYKVVRLGNHGDITATANNGGFVEFTLPLGHSLVAGAVILVAGHSVAGYNTTHQVTTATTTTIVTSVAYTAAGTGTATWTINGYLDEDDLSDDDLALNTALPILNTDNSKNARRQGMPPSECAVAAWFQDRMFYAVQRKYDTGTVATTAGSQTITLTGGTWIEEFGGSDMYPAREGEWLMQIEGEPKPIRIVDWLNASQMRATEDTVPTLTQSGASYVLYPDPKIFRNRIIYSEVDEAESVVYDAAIAAENNVGGGGYINAIGIQENTGDDDEITGLMPYGFALWVLKERHLYRITFSKQPNLEAGVIMVASRGCLNQRSWVMHDGLAYLMDSSGIYAFDTNSVEPISMPIQNLWREQTIDLSKSKWFFAGVDPNEEVVRFYVSYVGDTEDRPKRALCYHIRFKGWWVESYPWQLGGATKADIESSERLLVGGTEDAVYVSGEGFTDNGTTISYAWRSGKFSLPSNANNQSRALEVAFQPTQVAATLNANVYYGNESSPLVFEIDQNMGNGIQVSANSADIAINMAADALGDEEDQPGWVRQELGGRGGKLAMVSRWLSVALSGDAPSTEQAIVYQVVLVGVEGR